MYYIATIVDSVSSEAFVLEDHFEQHRAVGEPPTDAFQKIATIADSVSSHSFATEDHFEKCSIVDKQSPDTDAFKKICNDLINNPQAIPLPAAWVSQVISTTLPCIMWTEWKKGYSGIAKRIVLFSDMSLNVSNYAMNLN